MRNVQPTDTRPHGHLSRARRNDLDHHEPPRRGFRGGRHPCARHREELEEYAKLSAEYGVKLEFETWHTGGIWNLEYLIGKKLIEPPYFTSLFFGWPGGSWSPPTVEEYSYRRRYLPEGSLATVSIMDERQVDILAATIVAGDHIRVGTEDYPFNKKARFLRYTNW